MTAVIRYTSISDTAATAVFVLHVPSLCCQMDESVYTASNRDTRYQQQQQQHNNNNNYNSSTSSIALTSPPTVNASAVRALKRLGSPRVALSRIHALLSQLVDHLELRRCGTASTSTGGSQTGTLTDNEPITPPLLAGFSRSPSATAVGSVASSSIPRVTAGFAIVRASGETQRLALERWKKLHRDLWRPYSTPAVVTGTTNVPTATAAVTAAVAGAASGTKSAATATQQVAVQTTPVKGSSGSRSSEGQFDLSKCADLHDACRHEALSGGWARSFAGML
jgi:hypothetical protein